MSWYRSTSISLTLSAYRVIPASSKPWQLFARPPAHDVE
jgi:hypothetical protein